LVKTTSKGGKRERGKMTELEIIKNKIEENYKNGNQRYAGLKSHEIGTYNRALMFGEKYEAFDEDYYKNYCD